MRDGWVGSLALITQLGVTVVVSILIGVVLGQWVDTQLGTRPWGTLALSLIGILAGSVGVYRLVVSSIDQAVAKRTGASDTDNSNPHT